MPQPLITPGMVAEWRIPSDSATWTKLDCLVGVSSSPHTVEMHEVTARSAMVVKKVPGRMTPGTFTLQLYISKTNGSTTYSTFSNAMKIRKTVDVRIDCGSDARGVYWAAILNSYVVSLGVPTISNDMVTYDVVLQMAN